jgi:sarcosine oxidase subunit gamma
MAGELDVPFGRAARAQAGILVVGSGPGEWLLFAPPGQAADLVFRFEDLAGRIPGEPVSVVDLTHGRALMRLTGARAPDVLSAVCGIDLSDATTPEGAAFRSSVAALATDMIRDDAADVRSYLLHCERSSGRYLFDALLSAGHDFSIESTASHRQGSYDPAIRAPGESARRVRPARHVPSVRFLTVISVDVIGAATTRLPRSAPVPQQSAVALVRS